MSNTQYKALPQGGSHTVENGSYLKLHQTWKPLQYLNYYRLSLTALIVVLNTAGITPHPLGDDNMRLFQAIGLGYFCLSILYAFSIAFQRPSFRLQVYCHVVTDIIAISLMMHASGGVKSGLGVLLIASIAGGSLLVSARTAIFLAAIAALAMLGEQIFATLKDGYPVAAYTQAGLLGATFFAAAILAHTLASRLRESEALAQRHAIDLANMAQLTEYIIQRMQTGIIVVDKHRQVRLINESARHLLGIPEDAEAGTIEEAAPVLAEQLARWQDAPSYRSPVIRNSETSAQIQPRFARLGLEASSGTLVFLEDTAAMAQQAQQLKLASLGRLTASIAHEVRNPLGAISHAGQLLAESPNLDQADQRLTEIIQEHSQRVNTIIENIMQLSRRDRSNPEEFVLRPWLERFVGEFCNANDIFADNFTMNVDPSELRVRFDTSQLQQVLWNLCHNGLRHGRAGGDPRLELRAGMLLDSHKPFLEVCDHGAGIDKQASQNLFEPFFTTQDQGTGLGLYLSRELCECNQARLDNVAVEEQGACFRITFADLRRQPRVLS